MLKSSPKVSDLDLVPSNSLGGLPFREPRPPSFVGVCASSVVVAFMAPMGGWLRGTSSPRLMFCSIPAIRVAGPSSTSGLVPWVVTMWWSPAVMTSVEVFGCTGDVAGSRLSWTMGRLPSPSSFTLASRSLLLVQYPAVCFWSQCHLSFINSTGICCAVLGSSTTYPLSWFSRDETQRPLPSTSAGRSFRVLLCTSTHSPVLGTSMRRAASVVKSSTYVTALQGRGFGFRCFQGLLQRSQGDQLLVIVQALNVNCALSFKGREDN